MNNIYQRPQAQQASFIMQYKFAENLERVFRDMSNRQYVEKEYYILQNSIPSFPSQWLESLLPPTPAVTEFTMAMRYAAEYLANEYQYSPGEVMPVLLSALLMSTCGRMRLQIHETWEEALCLYVILAKDSGSRKSALMNTTFSPIFLYQEKLQQQFHKQSKGLNYKQKILKERERENFKEFSRLFKNRETDDLSELKQAILKTDSEDFALAQELCGYTFIPQLYSDALTTHEAATLLCQQGGTQSIISSEDCFTRADISNKAKDITVFLNAYDGYDFIKTTRGGGRIQVRKGTLNIAAAMQPSVLLKYYDKPHLIENGFLNRLFVCHCYYHPTAVTQDISITKKYLDEFYSRLQSLLERYYTQDPNRTIDILKMSARGKTALKEYEAFLEQAYGLGNTLSLGNTLGWHNHISKGYLQKEVGRAARIAAAIHIFENYEDPLASEVSAESVISACNYSKQLICHHAHANASLLRRTVYNGTRILQLINRHGFNGFHITDLKQGLNKISTDECLMALNLLEQKCLIKSVHIAGQKAVYLTHNSILYHQHL